MKTSEKIRILAKITTRDESGRHFTQIYSPEALAELESAGLLAIHRPIHDTGIAYSQDYWSVELTDAGIELGESRNWSLK